MERAIVTPNNGSEIPKKYRVDTFIIAGVLISILIKLVQSLSGLIAVIFLTTACLSHADQAVGYYPPNVILFIGDGMDDQQITLARNYLHGATGSLAMEKMPIRSAVKVRTIQESNPEKFLYVADSANTASTLATGKLTSKGRISTATTSNQPHQTILEAAQTKGLRTGIVTTASVTDATPAAFASHSSHRSCMGPDDMNTEHSYILGSQQCAHNKKQQGGLGSIAEQLVDANIDVLFGGGKKYFEQRVAGTTLLEKTKSQGYTLLQTRSDIESTTTYHTKLLGLFAPKHLPVEWQGEHNRRAERITVDTHGNTLFPTPFSCMINTQHKRADTPTLSTMMTKALDVLSNNNTRGFFLMVEGASIDKQAHNRNPCGQIGELKAFDEAIAKGQLFAQTHPNTLIIVTADHGHASQSVPLPESYQAASQATDKTQYPTGFYAVLKTPLNELMAISYATNSSPQGLWEMHTGVDVPAFMQGPRLNSVPITIDQPYINNLMRRHLELD